MHPIVNIVGPIILLLVLIFFTLRQWKRRPQEDAISERSAKELREELNREDQEREHGSR
ncbi:MAG: hypothetical protein V4579_13675 [Pseudomonadota bacterium]